MGWWQNLLLTNNQLIQFKYSERLTLNKKAGFMAGFFMLIFQPSGDTEDHTIQELKTPTTQIKPRTRAHDSKAKDVLTGLLI